MNSYSIQLYYKNGVTVKNVFAILEPVVIIDPLKPLSGIPLTKLN